MGLTIYAAETADGLTEVLKADACCVAYESTINASIDTKEEIVKKTIAGISRNDFDLFPLNSILASTVWNKNTDVFSPLEMWMARSSPVDKQFNYMHDESDIIGHITGSSVRDKDGNEIPDDTKIEDLPDFFDIVVSSVLYKVWTNEKLNARMSNIIKGIERGDWYVSMECLFSDFDYAVITASGEHKIIARGAETAFLTKHLRHYGGSGEFDGNKLGRLLKNITFSGKGLVDKPANPRSVIFDKEVSTFRGTKASEKEFQLLIGKDSMNELELAKAALAKAEAKLADAETANKAFQAKASEEATKVVEGLKAQATEAEAKAKKIADEAKASIELATKEATTAKDEAAKASKELAEVKAKATKTERKSQLVQAGASAEDADKLVEKFATANDEMFKEIVALAAFKPADKANDKAADDMDADEKKKKAAKAEMDEKKKKDDKKKEDDAAKAALEAAEAEKLNLAAGHVETDETKLVRSKASSWLSENVLKYQPAKAVVTK